MKENEEGYAMPLSAPTYTRPPFESTERSQIILVLYRGDKDAVAWEVPEPLEPYGDGTMLAWVGDMCQPSHTLDLYRESLTAIKVKYKGMVGWYINFIWVAHDIALLFERILTFVRYPRISSDLVPRVVSISPRKTPNSSSKLLKAVICGWK